MRIRPVAIAIAVIALGGGAFAHSGATGIVKTRMDAMKSASDAAKALTGFLSGAFPYRADLARRAAEEIAAAGGEAMLAKYPEGSHGGVSEALPAIWTDWDRFAAIARDMEVYAGALAEAAENPRAGALPRLEYTPGLDPAALALGSPEIAFAHVAATCSACHETFRKRK